MQLPSHRPTQRGIAVITVLLALAIGLLISSEIIMRVYMGMKRSSNQFNALQAWEYALGGEEWARQRLGVDFLEDKGKQIDHLNEDWAMPAQTLEIEGGFIEIEIYDLQARFNLNNLVTEEGQVDSKQLNIFRRLLQQVGISAVYADKAAQWASYDDDVDSDYGTLDMPYKRGDTQFGSISELRLLREMPLDKYRDLVPYITVLPFQVKQNINTASDMVLASLTKKSTPEKIKAFLEQRQENRDGYASPETFINAMGVQDEELVKQDLAVQSEFFEIRVRTEYNGRRCYLISVVHRDPESGEIRLVSRDRSQHFRFANSVHDDPADKDQDKDEDAEGKGGKDKQDKKSKKSSKSQRDE